jgi:hypothetical protein
VENVHAWLAVMLGVCAMVVDLNILHHPLLLLLSISLGAGTQGNSKVEHVLGKREVGECCEVLQIGRKLFQGRHEM